MSEYYISINKNWNTKHEEWNGDDDVGDGDDRVWILFEFANGGEESHQQNKEAWEDHQYCSHKSRKLYQEDGWKEDDKDMK